MYGPWPEKAFAEAVGPYVRRMVTIVVLVGFAVAAAMGALMALFLGWSHWLNAIPAVVWAILVTTFLLWGMYPRAKRT